MEGMNILKIKLMERIFIEGIFTFSPRRWFFFYLESIYVVQWWDDSYQDSPINILTNGLTGSSYLKEEWSVVTDVGINISGTSVIVRPGRGWVRTVWRILLRRSESPSDSAWGWAGSGHGGNISSLTPLSQLCIFWSNSTG